MNVWGGGDLLQILLGTVERRERRGAAGSSRASREGYISGRGAMGIQQLLALRLPIVGAPPFTVAQCVRPCADPCTQINGQTRSDQIRFIRIATCQPWERRRGVAPAADLLQCNTRDGQWTHLPSTISRALCCRGILLLLG
jgi:hypothetical protein